MKQAWEVYQKKGRWQMKAPDRNIDHRRVPNLATFFGRHGSSLPVSKDGGNYKPGDIVTWMLPGNLTHIGIVSDKQAAGGVPLVIHNIGAGARKKTSCSPIPSPAITAGRANNQGAMSCKMPISMPSAASMSSVSMAP